MPIWFHPRILRQVRKCNLEDVRQAMEEHLEQSFDVLQGVMSSHHSTPDTMEI
jgi:hypothetical protein